MFYRYHHDICFEVGAMHAEIMHFILTFDTITFFSIIHVHTGTNIKLVTSRENKGTEREAPGPGLGLCQFN